MVSTTDKINDYLSQIEKAFSRHNQSFLKAFTIRNENLFQETFGQLLLDSGSIHDILIKFANYDNQILKSFKEEVEQPFYRKLSGCVDEGSLERGKQTLHQFFSAIIDFLENY